MSKYILPVLLSVYSLLPSAGYSQDSGKKVVNRVVATVGDQIIMQSDVETQYLQFLAQGYSPDAQIRCRIIEELLFQSLLKTQAKIDSVTVSDNQVESELDRRLQFFVQQIGGEKQLEEYYGKSIIQIKSEFRDMIRDQLIVQTMQSKISGDVKVSPAEVRDFYKEIPEDSLPYINSEVELAQIVRIPEISKEEKNSVRKRLEEYRQQIIEGERSLAALASIYSEDPSYKQRGEIGFVGRGQLVPEFEAMIDSTEQAITVLKQAGSENLEAKLKVVNASLDSLKQLRCSGVVETQFGYHLIQLIERRGEQVNVRHILLRPKLSESVKREAQLFLDSIRTLIMNDQITFAEAVDKHSQDEDSKYFEGNIVNSNTGTTRFEMDELDPVIALSINNMNVGGISEPLLMQTNDGQEAYRIVLLKSRTSPHRMNLKDDYKRVQDMALAKKKAEVIGNWINKKKNNMYIHIGEDYQGCEFSNKWVN